MIDTIHQGSGLGSVAGAAVGVSTFAALGVLLPRASVLLLRRLGGFMKVHEHDALFRSVNSAPDITAFDDPKFHARLALARERGVDASGEVVSDSLLVMQSGLVTLSFVTILLAIYPLLVVCAIAAAAPMVMIELSLGNVRLASAKEVNAYSRERFLYTQAMTGHRESKEVRLLAIGDFLRERAITQFRKAVDAEHRLARREFLMQAMAGPADPVRRPR